MTGTALRDRTALAHGDVVALSEAGVLPKGLLLPFHEVRLLTWDEESGTGRIEAVRRNRLDDWYYGCHFLSDPVMPGCWGVDAVWQALRLFAAWRGIERCEKPMGMEGVSFFGQVRPYDREVTYEVDVVSVERDGAEAMVTGKATVRTDGVAVYSIASAQVGTAYWEGEGGEGGDGAGAGTGIPDDLDPPFLAPLSSAEFGARSSFSHAELIALSRGTLVNDPPGEMGLLPHSLMLEVHRVHRIAFDRGTGEGEVVASRGNDPADWSFPMNGGRKPPALLVDAVWQLLGLFLAWSGSPGTGRALGFERADVFDAVTPRDARIDYRVRILRTLTSPASGDAFVRADGEVFADGRRVLAVANANVGCHVGIRYADYPREGPMSRGGRLARRG